MDYRREVDGLRALAVLPVIFFHAGFDYFKGGFVGVDVFFVISGYLITTIILSELEQGKFSLLKFYERRARRILPALFFVMLACLPFAWLWLLPNDMRDFSHSLAAVITFSSNILFWSESGYFDTAAELKPLLHTWSLAVEEQFYVLFPLCLMFMWGLGKRWILTTLALIALASLALAQWGSIAYPAATFYLLPARIWELLIGAFVAFYLASDAAAKAPRGKGAQWGAQWGALLGLLLLLYSVFAFDKTTPFPSIYALAPTLGAALIIIFASPQNLVGRLLGTRALVGIGLISYSAYLWHQPLFAFARHLTQDEPGRTLFGALTAGTFVLAFLSWKYIETPFRQREVFHARKLMPALGVAATCFVSIAIAGNVSKGFDFRLDGLQTAPRWDPPIKCHGKVAISGYESPLHACLSDSSNGKGGDFFVVGDSHAAQLTFPLRALAQERGTHFHFINTESNDDFPRSFWLKPQVQQDRILDHLQKVADPGDILVVSFHRGQLNDSRDRHLPLDQPVSDNEKYERFVHNMRQHLPSLLEKGLRIYLVKDTPLLEKTTAVEHCQRDKRSPAFNFCAVSLTQDLHTRTRQSKAFDHLAQLFPDQVHAVDVLPALHDTVRDEEKYFNPLRPDGSYRMFDRHHLTEDASLELIPLLRDSIR